MVEGQDGEFVYRFRCQTFPSGRNLWQWEVRHHDDGFPVAAGAALPSQEAAQEAAMDAMARQRRGVLMAGLRRRKR